MRMVVFAGVEYSVLCDCYIMTLPHRNAVFVDDGNAEFLRIVPGVEAQQLALAIAPGDAIGVAIGRHYQ